MLYIVTDSIYTQHHTGNYHPERPERVLFINQALESEHLKVEENTLKPRRAITDEILLCHSKNYISKVEKECQALADGETANLSTGDVVISNYSFEVAKLAVGAVLVGIDTVFSIPNSKIFCVVRPPGHHASQERGAGFCIFNNVAIAARYAQAKYAIEKVLIADWDVHHGNGTQEIFYHDTRVFYFSTHEEGNYPGTGTREETGVGFTLNVPILPGKKAREKVLFAFQNQLVKAMESFRPELVLISCGFDAHKEDPLGHFDLTDEDFGTLTKIMMHIASQYAQSRIVSVLEGGYNLKAIARAAVCHAKELSR